MDHLAFWQKTGATYWKSFTSVGKRDVVGMLPLLAEVRRRREARKALKIVDEMRLVVIAAGQGEVRPGKMPMGVDVPHHFLEPAHAAKQLRRQPDFLGKELNEAPRTEANAACHLRDALGARVAPELPQGECDCGVSRQRAIRVGEEALFE